MNDDGEEKATSRGFGGSLLYQEKGDESGDDLVSRETPQVCRLPSTGWVLIGLLSSFLHGIIL